jgi:hypothetical protein
MLVGYGLISLWRMKPGQLAPGAETVYRAAEMAMEGKSKSSNGAPKPAMPSRAPAVSSFQQ